MAKKIRVWDGTAWQDVAPSLPYTAIHSAQASMPLTGVDGQVWLDTDGTLAGQDFVPLSGGTMTGNLNVPSINSGPIVGRNKILNGDFSIWQRGTSFNASGSYHADRWIPFWNGSPTITITRETFTPGSAPVAGYEGQYYLRMNQSVAGTGGTFNLIAQQRIEDVRTLAGQSCILSFWAKSDSARLINVGVRQNFGSGGSSESYPSVGGNPATTSTNWQRFSFPITMTSISSKTIGSGSYVAIDIYATAQNIVQTIDLWGVQLEAGNQVTPFHTATPNQQTELAACQRYYYKASGNTISSSASVTNYPFFGHQLAYSTTQTYGYMNIPVPMRVPPSLQFSSPGSFRLQTGNASYTATSIGWDTSVYYISPTTVAIGVGSSNLTQSAVYFLTGNFNSTAYVEVSAEL